MTGHLGDADQRFGRVVDLTRKLTESSVASELLDVMLTAASADGGYIAVPGRDGQLEIVSKMCGPAEVDCEHLTLRMRADAPPSSASTAIREGRSVWVATRADGERRFPLVASMVPWVRSWVALPLVARSAVFGVIVLAFDDELEFTDADRRTLESMATMCSVAMGAARAHRLPEGRSAHRGRGRRSTG